MANINESQDVETAGGSNFDDRHRPASGGGSKAPVRVPNRLISSIEGNNRLSSVFPYSLLENMCIHHPVRNQVAIKVNFTAKAMVELKSLGKRLHTFCFSE